VRTGRKEAVSENGKHTIRDKVAFPTIAAILAFLIVNLFTNVWPFVREFSLSFLRWCLALLIAFWNHLLSTAGVPWVIVYLSWALLALLLRDVIASALRMGGAKEVPRSYTEDTFFGILWRWELTGYGKLGLNPTGLTPFCPHCDMQLVHDRTDQGGNMHFRCESCDRVYSPVMGSVDSVQERVSRDIQRILRTGEWRKKLAKDRE